MIIIIIVWGKFSYAYFSQNNTNSNNIIIVIVFEEKYA